MTMRVTEMMRFNTMYSHLSNVQLRYAEILEKMASQRNINKISDDPSGVASIMNYKKEQSVITGYQRAIENAESWITITESQLTSAAEILINAREIALSQGTGTATDETRLYAAEQVSQLINQLQSIANYQYADRYLFSGTQTATQPFASVASESHQLGLPRQAGGNAFSGDISVDGNYEGTDNRSYVVKILSADEDTGEITWAVSSDGGRTWGEESDPEVLTAGTTTVPLDDDGGIDLVFESVDGAPAAGDIFYVDAFAAGYYKGNSDELSVEISKGVTFEYSITGDSVFSPQGGVDVFALLNELKEALEDDDSEAVLGTLDGLQRASIQVNTAIAKCGTRMNRLDIAKNNLTDLDFKLTELVSSREDVDISELVTDFAMQEIVLKATYSMAAQMGTMTLMDFLE